MGDFDVIVIGAGPAGGYAALTAATSGLEVALFEEHATVGWPRHDPGWLMECDFTKSMLSALGKTVAWTRAREYRLCDSETGKVTEKARAAGYLTRRDLLEKEVAARAIRAGAKLYLKTKVTKLVRKNGRVEGVETNSSIIPTASAQIVICADGIRSSSNGFALDEGLCSTGVVRPGVSYLLANADARPGIIEHFVSSNPELNYRCLWPHSKSVCYFTLPVSMTLMEMAQRQDNVISPRIKDACALEMSGYGRAAAGKYGQYFKTMVRDNVMFVGEASGGSGNIHGMIQGKFAAQVAAAAVREKDVSEKRLLEYQDTVQKTLVKAPFFWYSAREDFGSFDNWFRAFEDATRGITATEASFPF